MEREEHTAIVNAWLKDLSASVDEKLQLDEDGICSLQVEERAIITMEVSNDFPLLHLYSPVFPLPDQEEGERVAILTKVLELNAFQNLTRGGSIALVPGGNLLFYCFSLPIEGTDSAQFDQALGEFYSTSLEIKEYLKDLDEKEDLPEFRITA